MEQIIHDIISSINDVGTAITLCVVFTVFDTVTGVYKHFKAGDFKSSEVRKGFLNKIPWYLAILFGYIVSIVIKNPILLSTITIACLFSEGTSICENFRDLGVSVKTDSEKDNTE